MRYDHKPLQLMIFAIKNLDLYYLDEQHSLHVEEQSRSHDLTTVPLIRRFILMKRFLKNWKEGFELKVVM
jgi:hypothetical protein